MEHARRVVSAAVAAALAAAGSLARAQAPGQVYVAIPPCRIADTRTAVLGALAANTNRTFHAVGSTSNFAAQGGTAGGCGIPGFSGAQPEVAAVMLNFVAVRPAGPGDLRAWASDQPMPGASILNYAKVIDQTNPAVTLNLANGIPIPVRQDSEGDDLSVRADGSTTHVIIDVLGYFEAHADAGGTVTAVTGGEGLTGGTITTSGTLAVAFAGAGSAASVARSDHDHDLTYLRLGQAAGGSLSGTYPSPAIADAAVTIAKLSAAGSVAGQALVSAGATVGWGTPPVPARRYYLTRGRSTGSQALGGCAAGYHMAALMEIFNSSVLEYDTALGVLTSDSGSGPPTVYGWVRTGGAAATNNLAGVANCNAWASAVNTHYGTMVSPLNGVWDTSPVTMVAPWRSLTITCEQPEPVWCVEN